MVLPPVLVAGNAGISGLWDHFKPALGWSNRHSFGDNLSGVASPARVLPASEIDRRAKRNADAPYNFRSTGR